MKKLAISLLSLSLSTVAMAADQSNASYIFNMSDAPITVAYAICQTPDKGNSCDLSNPTKKSISNSKGNNELDLSVDAGKMIVVISATNENTGAVTTYSKNSYFTSCTGGGSESISLNDMNGSSHITCGNEML